MRAIYRSSIIAALTTTVLLAFAAIAQAENASSAISTVGFLYSNNQFTTLGLPGVPNTDVIPTGINDSGEVAGILVNTGCFLRRADQSVSMISLPGATKCVASHVNDAGSVVGWYVSANYMQLSFLASSDGNVTQISIPNCSSVSAYSINNKAEIVGSCASEVGSGVSEVGFLLNASGMITIFDPPSAANTFLRGINDKGQIVGNFYTAQNEYHAFLYSDGQFRPIIIPECSRVDVRAINNQGQILGFCGIAGKPMNEGFVLDTATGSFRPLRGPKSEETSPNAINNRGDIVGIW
jgi:probable HAF family extracellular repeat protein